jgi:hypothetical protein
MTGDKRLFKTYTTLNVPRKVFTASSSTSLTILDEDEVVLEIWNGSRYQTVGLKGCLHVQGISRNLFSVPADEHHEDWMHIDNEWSENRRWNKGRKPIPLENARRIVTMGQR